MIIFGVTLLTSLSLWSCKDKNTEEDVVSMEEAANKKALKIAVMPTEACLPIYVAEKLHLFDSLGVDVRLHRHNALSECRKALSDSIVEGADTAMTFHLMTSKKSRLSRIDQFADKVIAADREGLSHDIAAAMIDSLLKKGNHTFIVQVEDLRVRYDMLISGNVDAAMLPEPYATLARREGAKEIRITKDEERKTKDEGRKTEVKDEGTVFRQGVTASKTRREQIALYEKALAIARDSIKQYGKEHYQNLLR